MYKPSPANAQADFLLETLLRAKLSGVNLNGKILRDMLDVIEGTRRGHLNSKQNYNHATFKAKCRYRSKRAIEEFKGDPKKQAKNTVRDHAFPIQKLAHWLTHLDVKTTDSLWHFLDEHLVSVVITKEENHLLSKRGLGHDIPPDSDGVNLFDRYHAVGIEVIDHVTLQLVREWPTHDSDPAWRKVS